MCRAKTNARLTQVLLEMADGMRACEVMDMSAYEKIKLRHLGDAANAQAPNPPAKEIQALRLRWGGDDK
jgi:hypothetical protein